MDEDEALKELFRILKSRFSILNKKRKSKQIIEYRLKSSKGPQSPEIIKLGVVSDIEGSVENARKSAQKLQKQNVDYIIIAGDCYENNQIRKIIMFSEELNKERQMKNSIEPFAKTGIDTFVIPGNHEKEETYNKVIKELNKKYPKLRDMHKKTYLCKNLSLIFLGGYHNSSLTEPEGFTIDENDYEWLHKKLKQMHKKKKPILFVSHGPPMSPGMLDFLPFFGNVGDEVLSDIISSFKGDLMNLHGHIHEKSGEHYKFKNTISINISAITNFSNSRLPNTSIIEVHENKMIYKEI